LKPDADAVSIKVTEGNIDIDSDEPLKGAKPNKIENKTTVSEFVTHEPYDRQSSTARIKKFIDEAMAEIKTDNPDLTAQELQDIRAQLQKQPSVNAVANQINKIVRLNNNVNLAKTKLESLTSKAQEIDNLIKNNVKDQVINFVQGQVASAINTGIQAVRSFFRF
jgi:oligoendopeptidase F